MSNPVEQNEKDKGMLMGLISMLATSALQQMGKIVNPATQKTDLDLDMASLTIDMLAMIQRKTEGNLEKEEANMLKDSVSSLQLTFLDTKKDAESKGETSDEQVDDAEEKTIEDTSDDIACPSETRDHKDPKFHKSYEQ